MMIHAPACLLDHDMKWESLNLYFRGIFSFVKKIVQLLRLNLSLIAYISRHPNALRHETFLKFYGQLLMANSFETMYYVCLLGK